MKSSTLYPYASQEKRDAVEEAASELLTARVWQSLMRVARYPVQDPMVADVTFAAQKKAGEWIRANQEVSDSNEAGLTAARQSQDRQSRAAAQQMVANAAQTVSPTGGLKRRRSSSPSNGSQLRNAPEAKRTAGPPPPGPPPR